MPRPLLHALLHVLVPALVARIAWPARWTRAALVLVAMNLIDLDHLLADPVWDPNRCSLGFHPLHTAPAGVVWALLALWPPTRLIGIGALIHLALDGFDCQFMP